MVGIGGNVVNGVLINSASEETPLLGYFTELGRSKIWPWLPFIIVLCLVKISCVLLYMVDSVYFIFPFVLLLWTLGVCLHEFGHAYAAFWGGDYTVVEKGYLHLNPVKYANMFSRFMLPVAVMLLTGGWTFFGAAVYINMGLLRSRAWHTGVALAGPLGTLCFLVVLALPFWFVYPGDMAWSESRHGEWWSALALATYLQLQALVLNLMPIPPLDGFGALLPWLPETWRRYYESHSLYINLAGIVFLLLVVGYSPRWPS